MLNHIVLMGRLVRNPELRSTANGTPVASARIAVDRPGGEKADFIDLVAWRQSGEFLTRNFVKGQMLAVSGRLQIREWTGDGGHKRSVAEVVADGIYFAGGKPKETPEKSMDEAMEQAGSFRELPDMQDDGELPF